MGIPRGEGDARDLSLRPSRPVGDLSEPAPCRRTRGTRLRRTFGTATTHMQVAARETPEMALARELSEELCILVRPEDLDRVAFATDSFRGNRHHLVMLLYRVREWGGVPQGAEGQALAWVPASALSALDFTDMQRQLAALATPFHATARPQPSEGSAWCCGARSLSVGMVTTWALCLVGPTMASLARDDPPAFLRRASFSSQRGGDSGDAKQTAEGRMPAPADAVGNTRRDAACSCGNDDDSSAPSTPGADGVSPLAVAGSGASSSDDGGR